MHPFTADPGDSIAAQGELGLLRQMRNWLGSAAPAAPAGMGDDCAVLSAHANLMTTDSLVYGRHFDDTASPAQAGAKLLKRNISDIAAMGGKPGDAVLAMFLPGHVSLQWIREFTRGIAARALEYGIRLAGGDLAETDGFLGANLTLLGHAERPLLRSGARVGDHIYVSGALGASIAGKHLDFSPRLHEGQFLATRAEVVSCIDVTDGIAKDMLHLLGDGQAAEILPEALPMSQDLARMELDCQRRTERMLCDGEDYELLFTVKASTDPGAFEEAWSAKLDTALTRIGQVVNRGDGLPLRNPQGEALVTGEGYEHFR